MAVAETCLIITEGTVPALSSSPAAPVLGQLADLAEGACDDPPGLLALLAKVTDPRHRRGIRHRLVAILALAVCAVLAGARSFTATERRTLTVSCVTPGSRTAACRRDAALRVVYASEHEDSARWPAGTATGPGRVGAVACR